MNRRLYRSSEHKILGGVCGGLGDHFAIDPTWFRLGFVVLALAHGIGLVLYLVAWIIIPRQKEGEVIPVQPASGPSTAAPSKPSRSVGPLVPGIILIVLGMLFLLRRSFWWFDFHYIWPIVLIIIGGALLYRAVDGKNEAAETSEVTDESR